MLKIPPNVARLLLPSRLFFISHRNMQHIHGNHCLQKDHGAQKNCEPKMEKKNLLYKHRERVIQHLCKFLRNEMHSSKCHIPSL